MTLAKCEPKRRKNENCSLCACKEVSLFAREACPGVRETFRAIQKPIPLPVRRERRIFDDDDRTTTNHVAQKVSCKQIRRNVCRTAIASHFCADFNWKTNGEVLGGDKQPRLQTACTNKDHATYLPAFPVSHTI